MRSSGRVAPRAVVATVAVVAAWLAGSAPALAQVMPSPASAALAPAMVAPLAPDSGFHAYVQTLRTQALQAGVRPATLDAILPTLRYNANVVALDRAQPDDSSVSAPPSLANYLDRRLTPDRIAQGQLRYRDAQTQLRRAEAQTGVPGSIITGIWGMETFYGRVMGRLDLFNSLASLAYDGRRRDLFSREFIAAVKMVDQGLVSRSQMVGSWAGATGMPQFLPTSFLTHARDGDGDGRIDIWYSKADTFASIGNYLKKAGWVAGVPWGVEVTVAPGLDRASIARLETPTSCRRPIERHSRPLPLGEWEKRGVRARVAHTLSPTLAATLIEPDGPGGRAFLAFGNYRALLDYNCSNYYALSVGLLADAVK